MRRFTFLLVLVSCGGDYRAVPTSSVLPVTTTALVPRSDTWKVWDQDGNLGTAWRQNGFDDSGWLTRATPTGYGETYLASTIGFGPNANNKHVAYYFRHTFTVSAQVTALTLEMMYDDGFVAYVNGQEAARDKMPSGAVGPNTLAQDHEASNTYTTFTVNPALLQAGQNPLAIEVHQAYFNSSDLVFDASLIADIDSGTPPPAPEGGIEPGSVWKYWDQGGDLGAGWRSPGFNDSAWPGGAGPLGYGETYLQTTVSFGGNANNKHITTYFRAQFVVNDPAAVTAMTAQLMPAGPTFVKHAGNPVMVDPRDVEDPFVVKVPGGPNYYQMFYTQWAGSTKGKYYSIYVTQSPDGISWEPGVRTGVDGYSPVVRYDATAGVFRLWYLSSDFLARGRLWRAESVDGRTWTNRTLSLDKFMWSAAVLEEPDGLRLWYATQFHAGTAGDGTVFGIEVRYATDIGFTGTWTEPAEPVFVFEGIDEETFRHTVLRVGGEFRMWYAHSKRIGFSTSSDGLQWKHGAPALLPGPSGSWDDFEVWGPAVLLDDGGFRMWYTGRGSANFENDLGLAESP